MPRKLYVTVNGSEEPLELVRDTPGGPWAPAGATDLLAERTGSASFRVSAGGRTHQVQVMKDGADGPIRVRVAGRTYTVELQDERDRLMATLGLGAGAGAVAPELRAPMPGLVLNVLVAPGQEVAKGDPVIVLEAMKMENVIKAPGDARVKELNVGNGTAVEKGHLLLTFETP